MLSMPAFLHVCTAHFIFQYIYDKRLARTGVCKHTLAHHLDSKSSFLFSPITSASRSRDLISFTEYHDSKFGPEAEKGALPDKPAGTPVEVHGLRSRLVEAETAAQAPNLHEVDWAVPGGPSSGSSLLARKLGSLERKLAVGPDADGVGTGRPSIAPWEKPKPVCAGCPQPCPCRNGAGLKPWQLATMCRAHDGDKELYQKLFETDNKKIKACFDRCSPAELGCPNPPLPWLPSLQSASINNTPCM